MAEKKIALIGNPNVGKTTLFNTLTGLNQKTGNYPGITVEKKSGNLKFQGESFKIYDLPGIYSIYPSSLDEEIVSHILVNPEHEDYPDLAIFVIDADNLKRGMLLYQQIRALNVPTVFVINNIDSKNKELVQHIHELEEYLQTKVLLLNVNKSNEVEELKQLFYWKSEIYNDDFKIPEEFQSVIDELKNKFNFSDYKSWFLLASKNSSTLDSELGKEIQTIQKSNKIIPKRLQVKESIQRNQQNAEKFNQLFESIETQESTTDRIDKILTHPILGYLIFFGLLFLIFQAIYSWSEWPMDFIEGSILDLAAWTKSILPEGPLSDILTDGIIAGLAGIFVFIPQIAILFFFISIMESTGYMSRVVYLMDRWMKPFGLSGKSVVPFMSGVACAIPAILSARNIENQKERLITILVTPFTTCSARLPIYTIIIALVIPDIKLGIFNLKGLTLLALYVLGFATALAAAWILKKVLKSKYKSYLVLELPNYQNPIWRDVLNNVIEKTWSFIWGAGRIILAVSIILWVLGSYGFNDKFKNADKTVRIEYEQNGLNETQKELIELQFSETVKQMREDGENPTKNELIELKDKIEVETIDNEIAGIQLESSLLGAIGKQIEPIVQPLGMDWKMGIGVLSSFAAREVFVGTMSTLYSLGESDNESTIEQRMRKEVNPKTGKPLYNWVVGISILLFYAFAMQCMSTLAIVKRETNSWKWPMLQLVFMSVLAYAASFIFYQLFS